jgi:hypothetical protein
MGAAILIWRCIKQPNTCRFLVWDVASDIAIVMAIISWT